MKRFLLFFAMIFASTMFISAQVLVDFEDETTGPLTLHVMGCGDWDNPELHEVSETFMIVDNPDQSGINTSGKVMKFMRRGTDDGGLPWGGFWANCDPQADVSVNKYVHVKVWKPRISPIKFKLEGGTSGTLETASMYPQTLTGAWEDIVFDFTTMEGTYPIVAFMPDFEDPLTATGVQEIYFDDILINDDPNPITGGGPAPLHITFEDGTAGPLTLHVMGCGEWDNPELHEVSETFMVVDNPDPGGINKSGKVMKFMRRGTNDGGLPWGGFWANCDPEADITGLHYVHVKVWKPRISPLKFKLEGGSSGTLETASMYAQTLTGGWEDIVFDFTTMDGSYPVIAFMPDFEDPLTATDLQEIYFDDIMFSDDPNPIVLNPAPLNLNFEDGTAGPLTLHVMGCGEWDNPDLHPVSETFMIVDNPDQSGINTSGKVMKFMRRGTDDGGFPWGGFWANVEPLNDITNNKYCHVKVWKPRISPIKFKIEGGTSGTLETASMYEQTITNGWEDIVFDFTSMDGTYPIVAFMPDFEDPLTATGVQEIYFDDIVFNNDPNPIVAPAPLHITFEDGTAGPLTLHVMGCGDWDNPELHEVSETFMVVDNPDPSGINTSSKVMMFNRRGTDEGGFPWGGFWANCDPDADVTGNHYAHVKVWKPRISPLKFKVEGGSSGTLETSSMYEQTVIEGWEDIVFDFTTMEGSYPIIAFMPDFEDPLTATSLQVIYFDDIIFNNDPNPAGTGIKEPGKIDVSVYPNPCDAYLNLTTNQRLQSIIIYNVTGQVVLSMENIPEGLHVINTSDLVKGIYVLTVRDQNGMTSASKLVKD